MASNESFIFKHAHTVFALVYVHSIYRGLQVWYMSSNIVEIPGTITDVVNNCDVNQIEINQSYISDFYKLIPFPFSVSRSSRFTKRIRTCFFRVKFNPNPKKKKETSKVFSVHLAHDIEKEPLKVGGEIKLQGFGKNFRLADFPNNFNDEISQDMRNIVSILVLSIIAHIIIIKTKTDTVSTT